MKFTKESLKLIERTKAKTLFDYEQQKDTDEPLNFSQWINKEKNDFVDEYMSNRGGLIQKQIYDNPDPHIATKEEDEELESIDRKLLDRHMALYIATKEKIATRSFFSKLFHPFRTYRENKVLKEVKGYLTRNDVDQRTIDNVENFINNRDGNKYTGLKLVDGNGEIKAEPKNNEINNNDLKIQLDNDLNKSKVNDTSVQKEKNPPVKEINIDLK